MEIIKINLKKSPYNIIVGSDIITALGLYIRKLNIGSDAYIITNSLIKNKYGSVLIKTLKKYGFNFEFKLIPDSERSKSIKIISSVINDMASFDQKKRIFIVAFGGGVVGDLAGFTASVYKRGIPYIQVPTTLLAQVDSGIGGKTAVDLEQGKNLVGSFYQPRLVFSDTGVLRTLELAQIRSGLAEVIKYGVIKDLKLFNFLEKNYKEILDLKMEDLEFIVKRCSHIKARIVQEDEKEEKGIRTILNFGHTIGHAVEAAGGYKIYSHGEAVALGMLVATDISKKLGIVTRGVPERIEKLISIMGLPTKIKRINSQDIINSHYRDKKFIGAKNKFVLIKNIGETKILGDIPLGIIKEALKERLS